MPYSKDEVKDFIQNYRRRSIVELLLSDVNLTKRERYVVDECIREGRTQQEVANELFRDRCTVQRWQDSALKKIILAWGEDDLVRKIMH